MTGGFTAGTIVTAVNSLMARVQFLFGATKVTPSHAGLAPNFTGLYQFNVTVPSGLTANNAEPPSFTRGGTSGSQTLYIAIQQAGYVAQAGGALWIASAVVSSARAPQQYNYPRGSGFYRRLPNGPTVKAEVQCRNALARP